jgi:hypothetical protein
MSCPSGPSISKKSFPSFFAQRQTAPGLAPTAGGNLQQKGAIIRSTVLRSGLELSLRIALEGVEKRGDRLLRDSGCEADRSYR